MAHNQCHRGILAEWSSCPKRKASLIRNSALHSLQYIVWALPALILYVNTCLMFCHFLIMSIVNETALQWSSSKGENNDRNCVTLGSHGMALYFGTTSSKSLFLEWIQWHWCVNLRKLYWRVCFSISLQLGYLITTSLSFKISFKCLSSVKPVIKLFQYTPGVLIL